ncbi:MAG: 4Fe-4S binding protein [FCB group bacterium]|jgi:2-oxoglutarate ferredoxin oxidoreductase subunit delta
MKFKFFNSNHVQTEFIQLDRHKCQACWKCLENCPQNLIGKVDVFGHKHARINEPEKCDGCLICMEICESGAYTAIKI